MMNHHMPAGPGQHFVPPNMQQHPQSRRQQEYHTFHHPAQPHSPLPHPYANYGYPPQYYMHQPGPPPPQYPPQRWPHPYHPQYMPPPSVQQQHPPFQPRSPMVVSSQPYSQNMTPVTRHTPVPQQPPSHQAAPSPRPIYQHFQQQVPNSVAPPSPAPTPKQEKEQELPIQQREATPPPQTTPRRQPVDPLSLPPETRPTMEHELPKLFGDPPFPPRAAGRRRRGQNIIGIGTVEYPLRAAAQEEAREEPVEEAPSETSTVAPPSELEAEQEALAPETPATSRAPSEIDLSQASPSATTSEKTVTSPRAAPAQSQHARRDTRTAIAVPNIPGFSKPKASPPAAKNDVPLSPAQAETTTPTHDDQKPAPETQDEHEAPEEAAAPVTPAPKPAPKSWADLVRRNAPPPSTPSTNGATNGAVQLPKSASLADALQQYSVQIDAKLSFLEPRGLVNTGNMCYMNSILQVLVFCVPFYNFLDQVRQRTVHSMKSDTPLIDAMIMFMKEFRVLASAESADVLRSLLSQQQLEQYGESVTPEYVYDAIKKLERFNSMRRGHQQDAEEFFGFFLEGLHDECVSVMKGLTETRSEDGSVKSPGSVNSPDSTDGWLEVGKKQKAAITRTAGSQDAPSPITKIFGGHLRSELRVPGLKDSVTREPYKPLQLDIGAPHVNNIIDALKGLTRTEALTGEFGGRSNSAKKQVFIDTLPPILILHLKRFQYENSATGTQKIWKKVGYPLELEIPKDVFQPSKRGGLAVKGGLPQYRLKGVVYHHGKSAAGGHYTVDVLREDGREWIRIDDTIIRRIRPEDVAEGGSEEDPKILAKALEQHKNDAEMQKQRNIYQGLDEDEKEPEVEKPWSEVNGHALGHKKGNSVANTNGTATPVSSTAGKRTPTGRKEGVRDNKVAYILLYERIRG